MEYVKSKAHIPPEIGFALGVQRENVALGTQRHLYAIDWRRVFASGVTQILGFGVGGNAHFGFGVGGFAFSDTNMLVSPTRNSGVGGLSQHQDPTQMNT